MNLTYPQAIITGFVQGITELFPISSLGHAVLVPAWIGGSWKTFTTDPDSAYLSITVALHFASALALFWVFRFRWIHLISGGLQVLAKRPSVGGSVFWRIVIGTIPVAALGFIFEKPLRTLFSKPLASACFLTINGIILIVAERASRKAKSEATEELENIEIARRVSVPVAISIGFAQALALFSGISRFGITMSAGLFRGLSHRAASDFAFLLALPVILGASIVKLPELFTPENADLAGPLLAGSIVSFISTYASVTFLIRYFKSRTLYPFAIYCLILGIVSVIRFI
ncbi:MAG: undecaprenyl-diphosphate phosphatase [Actinobacteria bacterium]|nr:undecaprenyl-diphosphate phosphatase [Actinomycetota bacterium]